MPTAFTAPIKDGIDFAQFAMLCARAFGATIRMRDNDLDATIPERFDPSAYYADQVKVYQAEIEWLKAMSLDEIATAAKEAHLSALQSHCEARKADRELHVKYTTMIYAVKAWRPPTPDHVPLKNFMLEQIDSCLHFDCSLIYSADPVEPAPAEWHSSMLDAAQRSLDFHIAQDVKERERVDSANQWLADLRSSLGLGSSARIAGTDAS